MKREIRRVKAIYPARKEPNKYHPEFLQLFRYTEGWVELDRSHWSKPWCWLNLDHIRYELIEWTESLQEDSQ